MLYYDDPYACCDVCNDCPITDDEIDYFADTTSYARYGPAVSAPVQATKDESPDSPTYTNRYETPFKIPGSKWSMVEDASAYGAKYHLTYSDGKKVKLVTTSSGAMGYQTGDGRVRTLPKSVVNYLGKDLDRTRGLLANNNSYMQDSTAAGPAGEMYT